jgi:hypothetical protein
MGLFTPFLSRRRRISKDCYSDNRRAGSSAPSTFLSLWSTAALQETSIKLGCGCGPLPRLRCDKRAHLSGEYNPSLQWH